MKQMTNLQYKQRMIFAGLSPLYSPSLTMDVLLLVLSQLFLRQLK